MNITTFTRKLSSIIFAFCLVTALLSGAHAQSRSTVTAVYFFSPTCGDCQRFSDILSAYQTGTTILKLTKYDISDLRCKNLLNAYCSAYHVRKDDFNLVPILFIGNTYVTDLKGQSDLEALIKMQANKKTLLIKTGKATTDDDSQRFSGYGFASSFLAGFLNGLNPCSMSMILFFFSLLVLEKKKVAQIGLLFCAGKFLGYFMLGTVFYGILNRFTVSGIYLEIKYATVLILFVLILLNFKDLFAAKNQHYEKIILKLPKSFIKFNYSVMQNAIAIKNSAFIPFVSFLAGVLISFGEFLCTGQIYLATIVSILNHSGIFNPKALGFFIIYDLGFILPLALLTFAVIKGKTVFELSNLIREKIQYVKLVNAVVLLIFAAVILLFL